MAYTGTEQDTAEVLRWKALKVDVPHARMLREQVVSDANQPSVRGVHWWKDHLDDPRRILLTDYLLALLQSVSINLCEAALHWEELEEQRVQERVGAVELTPGMPPRFFGIRGRSVVDDLTTALTDMHAAGFFRALASAIDCFAGSAGIVCCVPKPAQKMDYGRVKGWLFGEAAKSPRLQALHPFAIAELTPILDQWKAKSDGQWLPWLLAMRHQYVHQGRRLICVIGDDGLQFPTGLRTEAVLPMPVHHLPDQPHFSEVQALRRGEIPVLAEPIKFTTTKLKRLVKEFINDGFSRLNDVWDARRSNPSLCPQPLAQWDKLFPEAPHDLSGFAPRHSKELATQIRSDPDMAHRLMRSALDDQHRHLWDQWDPPQASNGQGNS